jgi:PPK2 family polyphosphate:nucleotide phosphotransferase
VGVGGEAEDFGLGDGLFGVLLPLKEEEVRRSGGEVGAGGVTDGGAVRKVDVLGESPQGGSRMAGSGSGEERLGECGLGGYGEPGDVEGVNEVQGREPGSVDNLGEEGGGGLRLVLGKGDEGVTAEALAEDGVLQKNCFFEGETGGEGEELVDLVEGLRLRSGSGRGRGDRHLLTLCDRFWGNVLNKKTLEKFRVPPGKKFRLKDIDPGWKGELKELSDAQLKASAERVLAENLEELAEQQSRLYAHDRWSVLVILQAMDAAGKDGMVKHVTSGLNPQGCEVYSFKTPSAEELDHTYLWRIMRVSPARGKITIFNRSHYEEVLVVKVHPEYLLKQRLPDELLTTKIWEERYEDINGYERHLARNGTVILKFFLHVSKDEQKKRLLERADNPEKNWKFSVQDLNQRQYWDDYMRAYEEALRATSTKWAPWYVIPSDNKQVARMLVSNILAKAIAGLKLEYPRMSKEEKLAMAEARKRLAAE